MNAWKEGKKEGREGRKDKKVKERRNGSDLASNCRCVLHPSFTSSPFYADVSQSWDRIPYSFHLSYFVLYACEMHIWSIMNIFISV